MHGSSLPKATSNAAHAGTTASHPAPVHPEHLAAKLSSDQIAGKVDSVQASTGEFKVFINVAGEAGWPKLGGCGLDQRVSKAIQQIATRLKQVDSEKPEKGPGNLTMKALWPRVEGEELKAGCEEVKVRKSKYMPADLNVCDAQSVHVIAHTKLFAWRHKANFRCTLPAFTAALLVLAESSHPPYCVEGR